MPEIPTDDEMEMKMIEEIEGEELEPEGQEPEAAQERGQETREMEMAFVPAAQRSSDGDGDGFVKKALIVGLIGLVLIAAACLIPKLVNLRHSGEVTHVIEGGDKPVKLDQQVDATVDAEVRIPEHTEVRIPEHNIDLNIKEEPEPESRVPEPEPVAVVAPQPAPVVIPTPAPATPVSEPQDPAEFVPDQPGNPDEETPPKDFAPPTAPEAGTPDNGSPVTGSVGE